MERLQKVIAQAGICSRRKAEELILDGKDGNVKETRKITFNYPKVDIYAGGKDSGSIQILEGGSSPIPEYALKKKKTKNSGCIII